MNDCEVTIDNRDIEIEWFSGTGKGGQHRNKHQNSCRVKHLPTGLIETRQGRKRQTNLSDAKAALQARINADRSARHLAASAAIKKSQVGSGMRGDKTVTIRMQDNRVQHHGTGKTMRANKYMSGHMDQVW